MVESKMTKDLDMLQKLPNHVGIIMDGNGRWATERGLSRTKGHQAGAKNLKKLLKHILKRQIKFLSIYAFSTENFKRSKEEVDGLMNLFVELFRKELSFLEKEHVRVCFSGRRYPLPIDVLESMDQIEEHTKKGTTATFHICLNYGGQDEIVDMVKKVSAQVLNQQLDMEDITKEIIEKNLYQVLPPLDFIIRTSGEYRISNFMLWQSAYAEYYFPKVYFPDFDEKEFDQALLVYQSRNRRFGGVKHETTNF